jgi:hypothetical protein
MTVNNSGNNEDIFETFNTFETYFNSSQSVNYWETKMKYYFKIKAEIIKCIYLYCTQSGYDFRRYNIF